MLSTVQQPKAVNKKTWLSLCYINFKTMQWTVTINSAQSYLNMHVYKSTGSLGPSGPRLLGGTSGLLTSSFAPFDIWGIVHSSSWIDRKIPRCSGVPRTRTNINFEFGNILKFTILVFFGHLLWVCWWRLLVPPIWLRAQHSAKQDCYSSRANVIILCIHPSLCLDSSSILKFVLFFFLDVYRGQRRFVMLMTLYIIINDVLLLWRIFYFQLSVPQENFNILGNLKFPKSQSQRFRIWDLFNKATLLFTPADDRSGVFCICIFMFANRNANRVRWAINSSTWFPDTSLWID